ncbi:hypothetical protein HON71_03365 [Candidatus Woesearchaeota archaeon]|jgi:hypothetical protein|nr:hypothetical protein [Candidatus Woesearchaeota archaeon]MBT5343064.1 hypothetical protein [Candidatus Woesearchaeota archaeon]
MKINNLVKDLFNSMRSKAAITTLAAGLALGGAYGCGDTIINNNYGSEDVEENGTSDGEPTYEGICDDYLNIMQQDKDYDPEVHSDCLVCEPETYYDALQDKDIAHILRKQCAIVYCSIVAKNDPDDWNEKGYDCIVNFGYDWN